MKWLLFLLSLVALLFAYNALFMMPGNYDWLNFAIAGVAIPVAAILAWLSGKRFTSDRATLKELMLTPPAVVWIFVLLLFCGEGLARVVAYLRH